MNKKLSSIAGSALLAAAVSAANAANYNISGDWVDLTFNYTDALGNVVYVADGVTPAVGIGSSSGAFTDSYIGADLHITGTVETTTNTAGYSVVGGTIHVNGTTVIAYGASPSGLLFQNWQNVSGYVTDDGAVLNSGTFCLGFYNDGACSVGPSGFTDVSVNNFLWDGTGTFSNGYATTQGLNLLGGAGGASFTVAQPGDLIPGPTGNYLTGATGVQIVGGSNPGGIFLGGELTFTEVSAIPVPAAAWLFGSALVGLAGIGRRRS